MSSRVQTRSPVDIENVASNWILRRDAGLTPAEEAEFARWQAEDPRHAEAVARKDTAWAALGRPRESGQADWLLQRLAARAVQRHRRRIGVAAAAIFLLAGSFYHFHWMASPRSPDAQGVVLLPETQRLPDGSVVELRRGAELALEFGGPLRRVILKQGAAHFQVAKDGARPFVVKVGSIEFRAVGTAFSVEVANSQVEMLVTEGRVAVDKAGPAGPPLVPGPQPIGGGPAGGSLPETLTHVDAGNRILVELQPESIAPAPVPVAVSTSEMIERLAWRVPRLEFSELPLAEAVALMNRYNTVQFAIDDAALARLRISGLFRADNIDTFVRLLEGTCGIESERSGAIIVLKKADR